MRHRVGHQPTNSQVHNIGIDKCKAISSSNTICPLGAPRRGRSKIHHPIEQAVWEEHSNTGLRGLAQRRGVPVRVTPAIWQRSPRKCLNCPSQGSLSLDRLAHHRYSAVFWRRRASAGRPADRALHNSAGSPSAAIAKEHCAAAAECCWRQWQAFGGGGGGQHCHKASGVARPLCTALVQSWQTPTTRQTGRPPFRISLKNVQGSVEGIPPFPISSGCPEQQSGWQKFQQSQTPKAAKDIQRAEAESEAYRNAYLQTWRPQRGNLPRMRLSFTTNPTVSLPQCLSPYKA